VLRQFHAEGFVNEYTLDSVSADGKLLEFTTVRIENIAPAWRAKEFFRVLSPDEFVETFSLAAPGKPFEVYSETHPKAREVIRVPMQEAVTAACRWQSTRLVYDQSDL
jgi:hypothetical protein